MCSTSSHGSMLCVWKTTPTSSDDVDVQAAQHLDLRRLDRWPRAPRRSAAACSCRSRSGRAGNELAAPHLEVDRARAPAPRRDRRRSSPPAARRSPRCALRHEVASRVRGRAYTARLMRCSATGRAWPRSSGRIQQGSRDHTRRPASSTSQIEDAGDSRDHEQGGEQQVGAGVRVGLEDQMAQPRFGADELADDCTDDGQRHRRLGTVDHRGQRRGNVQAPERRRSRRADGAEVFDQRRRCARETAERADHHREEGEEEGHQNLRRRAVADPHDHQRRQRDLRQALEGDDQRVDGPLRDGGCVNRQSRAPRRRPWPSRSPARSRAS